MHKYIEFILFPSLIALSVILAGCGGGSPEGSAYTTSSRGIITGFGSIYVNGVKYSTDHAEIEFDDDVDADDSNFRIGQIVTVTGVIDDSGTSGTASHINYENEVQGPIVNKVPDSLDPLIGTMDILGIQILVNQDTRFDDGLTFADFINGDFAEISGFVTDTGITATYIEKQSPGSEEVEIVGNIEMLDTDLGTFEIHGFPVVYDITDLDDDLVLEEGLYVEVKGNLDGSQTTLIATEIEAEDDSTGDDHHEAEIQGLVSNYDSTTQTFYLGVIKVDASSAILEPATLDLSADPAPEVEAEGYWLDGVLIADEIEQKGQKIEISAVTTATDASAGTITFNFNGTDIIVRVNHQTEMEDDTGSTTGTFTLSDLSVDGGDYVEIEAFNDGSGDINAVELDRKSIDEVKIQAPVEDYDSESQSVTLMGIDFDLSSVSSYKNAADQTISDIDFFGALSDGVFIELKDSAIGGDGTIDEAELED